MKAKWMKILCIFLGVGIFFLIGCAAKKPASPAVRDNAETLHRQLEEMEQKR